VKVLSPLVDRAPFDEEIHLLLIEAQQDSAQPDAALGTASKAIARFPSSAPVHCWMGLELKDAGQFAASRIHLEKALQFDKDYALTYAVLGDLAMKEEKYEEASRRFRTAAAMRPEDAEGHIGWSRALEKLGRAAEAIQVLERAGEAGPRIHLELSQLYARRGDAERARREAELYRRKIKE
jgi:tetratricopeptide (TPR) repeat protein